MSRAIAVCACPPLPNPGMASVDLALYKLFEKYFPNTELDLACLYLPLERNPDLSENKLEQFKSWHNLPFEYQSFRNQLDRIYEIDIIIFWGDFLHSRDYLYQVSQICQQIGAASNEVDAMNLVLDHFYLKNAPKNVMEKTILFGGTFIFNRAKDYLDKNYNQNLIHLLNNVKNVWMRDIYSSYKASSLLESNINSTLGTDCSMLLKKEDIENLPKSSFFQFSEYAKETNVVGLFFGRNTAITDEIIMFVDRLCNSLNLLAEWIPWFPPFILPNYHDRFLTQFKKLGVNTSKTYPMLGDLLKRIGEYKFIITDTYHVCLNAWRNGVPAICIGEILSYEQHDVSNGWQHAWRDKRQTFYFMYDAMDFYVYKEELLSQEKINNRVYQLIKRLEDSDLVAAIFNRISKSSESSEKNFISSIRELI